MGQLEDQIETRAPGRSYRVPVGSQANPWPRWAGGKRVFKLPEDCGWMVSSSRAAHGSWLVTAGYDRGHWFTCECEAGTQRGKMGTRDGMGKVCVHVLAVATAERDQGFAPRPAGNFDASRLVD